MSDQVWNFAAIEGAADEVQSHVGQTHGLLDEGKAALTKLQSLWQGEAQGAYEALQTRWDTNAAELNEALQNLGQTIREAGQSMQTVEHGNAGSFQ